MKNRTNVAPWIIFVALCVGAFCAPWILPWAEAQRTGYVEKTASGAIANQLAPNPAAGLVLTPVGTDTSKVQWGTSSSGLPPGGTPGEVLGVVNLTATRTMVVTGSQTSVGTQTYSYATTSTGTSTATQTVTGATGTYTYTATGTSTGLSTSGEVTVGTFPRSLALSGNTLYVANQSSNNMMLVDVANPASMSVSATYGTCVNPRGIGLWTSSAPLIGCSDNHAQRWYCATPTTCSLTFDYAVDDEALQVATAGSSVSNYGLLANSTDNNMQIVNLSTGSVSGKISTITGCGGNGVSVLSASLAAFSCNTSGRVYAVDYSNPASPSTLGYVSVTEPSSLYSWGGRYTAIVANSSNRIHIMDSNDPNSPSIIGYVDTGASTGPRMVSGYGAYLYATMGTSGELKVISVADPASPTVVGTISVGTEPRGVVSNGTWAFVALSTDGKVKSVDVSRFQTISGTRTTTNTQTVTGTVTNTLTNTATGTQTVGGTSVYTASATGIGTGTGTEAKWQGANVYDPAGTFFLSSYNGEGSDVPLWLRWNEMGEMVGSQLPHSYSATCSTGSDGLIATIEPLIPQLVSRLRVPAGWWKAHLKTRVNANGAAIRVEVWHHGLSSIDMKLFDFTTDVFTSVAPSIISKEYLRSAEDTGSPLRIFFKLYATCSTSTTVTLDLGDSDFDSRIQSPFLGDRILASEVQQVGNAGNTVQDVLTDFGNSRRTTRKFMIPAAQFEYISLAPRMTLGTAPNILSVIKLEDGDTQYASAALVTIPADLATTSVSVVPVWAPAVTDTWAFAKIRWSLTHKVLQHYPTPTDATAAGTTTVWSGYYCGNNCTANYVQEYDGYTITGINAGDTVMFSIARLGADAADTFVGDINLIGVRIEYTSSL
jgi:hypothetical protein